MNTNARSIMNRRIVPPLVAAVAAVTLLLAGCGTDPKPTPKPTHSTAKPSPTPTVGQVAPAQDEVAAPKSGDEAKAAAVKTTTLYFRYDFQLLANPELGADYLKNYVDGNALKIAQDTAKYGVEQKRVAVGGPVTFQPNYGLSYTGVVTASSSGQTYPDAIAYMIGCADNSALKFSTNGAEPTPLAEKTTGPVQITVQWTPDVKVWRVTDVSNLTGQSGAPQC